MDLQKLIIINNQSINQSNKIKIKSNEIKPNIYVYMYINYDYIDK